MIVRRGARAEVKDMPVSRIRTRDRGLRGGTASVEMAMVTPFLVIALFGIIEFGMIFSSLMQLNNVTREGARVACTGATTTEVLDRMDGSLGRLDPDAMTVLLEFRTYSGGYWSSWQTLTDDGVRNTAPLGAQIRVRAAYDHHLMLGGLFGRFADNTTAHTKTLRASAVMRRE